jgi:hypothetical protein
MESSASNRMRLTLYCQSMNQFWLVSFQSPLRSTDPSVGMAVEQASAARSRRLFPPKMNRQNLTHSRREVLKPVPDQESRCEIVRQSVNKVDLTPSPS